jgi:DNA-binding GntR family transcriptional regulator
VKQLTQVSLREQAAESIRAGVVSGELAAGEILSAATIAGRLGVSVTPVREAMLDLATAGLVEPVRNRGYRVVEVSERDLDEIIELRVMIEAPAMALVVERAGDADLEALAPHLDGIEEAAHAGDVSRFLLHDRQFHLGLLELAGNRRLVDVVGTLRDQTRLVGLQALAREHALTGSALEHRPILAALLDRDAERAQRLMREHLQHARGTWAGLREAEAGSAG